MIHYEAKVEYTKQTAYSDGMLLSQVKETYMVDAESPTDCEARLKEELTPLSHDGITIVTINKRKLAGVINPDANKDFWYKGVFECITLNDSGKEQKTKCTFLVLADNIKNATQLILDDNKGLAGEVIKIERTSILDFFMAKE